MLAPAAGLWTIRCEDANAHVSSLLADLDEQERMLIVLCRQLYEGCWDDMLTDLRDRLAGKPHVFEWGPMSDRMEATVRRHMDIIGRLRQVEQTHGIRLTEMIEDV